MHTAKDHSKTITKDIQKSDIEDNFDKSIKLRCYECNEVVSLDNKFNEDMKDNHMSKHLP